MNSLFHIQNIYWREPLWLLLAFQPVIILIIKKLINKNALSLYVEKKLQPWVVFPTKHLFKSQIFNKNTAYLFAWIFFAIALSGPRIALNQDKNALSASMNIMLLIDHSRSMTAIDVLPNRIQRTKIEIDELLDKVQGHRIGITVFSARPHLYVPLTSDHAVLKTYLNTLDNLSFPTLGSDAVSAILFSQKQLKKTNGKPVIVLITDGDLPAITDSQLQMLKQANIPLYILGIGTLEGEAIPLKNGSWLKHNQKHIISKMNEPLLRELASQLNGKYSSVYDNSADWDTLYDNGISQHITFSNRIMGQRILWNELFIYFLIPSALLFWFSLSTRKLNFIKNIKLFPLVFLITLLHPFKQADAIDLFENDEQLAYRAYFNKDYKNSNILYKKITGYKSNYGQANNLYKQGHFKEAIPLFTLAIINAENESQRVNALYNLGNSYFRTGDFTSSIKMYKDVLIYQPTNAAALHNIHVSSVLKKNIELRIKEKERIIALSRQGQGPRTEKINDGTEIGENTSVSISDSVNTFENNIPLPEIPNINQEVVNKLIMAGLKNIKLADQSSSINNESNLTGKININLTQAHIQLNKINDAQHLLWKRLFEIEEGFPAPVQEPKILPGVAPW